MIIVEHEAKAILKTRGLPIPNGAIAHTPAEARSAADVIGGSVVLKAQIPIGGRMKAGAVIFADTPDEAERHAAHLLGATVRGYQVERLLVEQMLQIARELYIAVTYDAMARSAVLLTSVAGGIEVETVQNIVRFSFSTVKPISDFVGRDVAAALGFEGSQLLGLGNLIRQAAECFLQLDALLLEWNPVVLDRDGRWWIADVHLDLDDDALYRQSVVTMNAPYSVSLAARRSDFEQQALEIDQADHRGVAGRLIRFDGNIGLLIGGGGASLTTMDALLDAGLKPANYCEIGGNPSVWKIKELTKLILSQPQIEKLVVIMNVVSNTRADLIARGVIKGILEAGRDPARVLAAFRIPGSWEDESHKILDHYGVRYFGRETSIEQVVDSLL